MKKYIPENPVFSDEFNIIERTDLVNAQTHNDSVKQIMDNEVALKNQLDRCIGSMEGDKPQFVDGIKSDNVVDAVNEVFQLGSEKKQKLVENLIAMGIDASTEETWENLLNKVLSMTDTSKDTVTAPVLLTGYTAHNAAGEAIEGDMPEMAAITVEATSTTQDDEYTYLGLPGGHYNEDSKVRTKNSNLSIDLEQMVNNNKLLILTGKQTVYPGDIVVQGTFTCEGSAAYYYINGTASENIEYFKTLATNGVNGWPKGGISLRCAQILQETTVDGPTIVIRSSS